MLTAARTAGALLHAGEHETLAFQKIYVRVREHIIRPRLQEEPEAADLVGGIAGCCCLGYVHSQGGASAAGNQENPNAVSRRSLLVHNLLELVYRIVRQTYHTSSSTLP